jgi:protein gp37
LAQQTSIEWTEVSWNPVHGCSKVSPGCAHCYAEALSRRFRQTPKPWTPANVADNVILKPARLLDPVRNRKPFDRPRLVFVNSMSDLFHEAIPDDYIAKVFAVMGSASQHTYQVLTKRAERMRDYLSGPDFVFDVYRAADELGLDLPWGRLSDDDLPVFPNVWLGVSIENRRFAYRASMLRETPAAVRFISAEPLLGPLVPRAEDGLPYWDDHWEGLGLNLDRIDWLIVGGESGHGHRPIRIEWVRDLRDACLAQCDVCQQATNGNAWRCETRTAFFFKQWGGRTPKANGRELDGRTWDEMPLRFYADNRLRFAA